MELPLREDALNEYLDNIVSESQQAKKEPSKHWDEYMRYYNGDQWQTRLPSHRIPVTANYTAVTVKRLAALITDTKPNIEVKSYVSGLKDLTEPVLTPTIRANWDEQGYDQKLAGGLLPISIILGSCAAIVTYDRDIGPYGNIGLPIIDPRSLILDPTVQRPADLDQAEYSGYQTVMSLSKIRQLFPDHGKSVEPDPTVSRFLDNATGSGASGFMSPGHRFFTRTPHQSLTASYAVPRARLQELYINDPRTVGELPVEAQEHFMSRGLTRDDLAWPGGRRIVRAGVNNKILIDHPNPYIDRKTPIVMYDWGLQTEHPWGSSEVAMIKSLQAVLNKLSSSIIEKAVKMNNNIWIGDRDALEKKEWADLNDAPGLLVKVKPGRTLKRESAPALPGSVFQMIQWLVNTIETLTGLVDVTQGKRPVGLVSASALESLNLAAQTLIRYQARKFEAFLERVGKRMIARIFQFYDSDRIMHMLGQDGAWQDYSFERRKMMAGSVDGQPFDVFKHLHLLGFLITPGSSMAITRIQKAQLSMALFDKTLVPGENVLRSLEWNDPKGTVQQARAEAMMGMQNPGGGGEKRLRVAR